MTDVVQLQVITTDAGMARILAADTSGLRLKITHVGLGDAGWSMTAAGARARTALQHEVVRVPIVSSRTVMAQRQLDISAVADGNQEFWAREIGFFDEAGTLVFAWSDPTRPLGYKSAPSRFLIGMSLTVTEVPLGAIQIVDQGQPLNLAIGPLEQALSGEHAAGGAHTFGLPLQAESDWVAESSQGETLGEILRGMGQSGVFGSRQYGRAGTEAFNRCFDDSYAAINLHNHPNLLATAGLGEMAVLINGRYVRTRHNDYRLRTPVAGSYLAMADVAPPAVPASVTAAGTVANQVNELREYFKAFATSNTALRDFRPHFRWGLSVLEIWPEVLTGDITDTFNSFRHFEEVANYRDALNKQLMLDSTGHNGANENGSWVPGSVQVVSNTGRPQFVAWRYRITSTDIGSVGDYPVDQLLTPLDLPIQRWHRGITMDQLLTTRGARFRLNRSLSTDPLIGAYVDSATVDLLDELMAKVPGLNGAGASLPEDYTDSGSTVRMTKWNSAEELNSAYYNRRYGHPANASGRTRSLRSWNDPMLFTAANTRPEVAGISDSGKVYRRSYAIPLELILRTPLEGWNPYGLPLVATATGDGATAATAYNGITHSARYYITPAEMFADAVSNPDPADTGATARYVKDAGGTARLVRASGIYSHLPTITGAGSIRLRYPIYPVWHEGSHAHALLEAVLGDLAISQARELRVSASLQDRVDEALKRITKLEGHQFQSNNQHLLHN